jgi:hypothetical protein
MLSLLWKLSAWLCDYRRVYIPSNRTVDRLRGARGRKWAIPVSLIATPSYLFAMSVCATIVEQGGPAYLNLLVLLFAWNAVKFAATGVLIPAQWSISRLRPVGRPRASRIECGQSPVPSRRSSAPKLTVIGRTKRRGERGRL